MITGQGHSQKFLVTLQVQIDLKYDISFMDEKTRVKFRRTLTETGLCFTWGSSVGHLFTSR